MITSAVLTDSQISALNAIVPSFFKVKTEENVVLVEFYSPPETRQNALLLTFNILPLNNPDYEGNKLAEVVEDLCATIVTLYNEYAKMHEMDVLEKAMKLVIKTVRSVKQRKLQKNELEIINRSFESIDTREWFG